MDSTHRPTHLADLIEQAAARHPDHPALIDAATGATLTWAEFDAAVSAEARRLAAEGVVAGDRVVIHCGGPALAVAVAGAMRAGAVAVPVAPGEVAAVVARCAPRVLVADEQASVDVTALGPPDLDARGERLAAVGGGEDLALLLHTSAGRAVCLSHRAVLANRAQAAALRPAPVTPVDRVLLTLPLFHAYGLAAGLFQVCWAGATAVLPAPGRPDGDDLADAVERHRVSTLAGVPSTYRALLELPAERLRTALAGLRLCMCGGVPLPRPWATAFHEATGHRVVEGYGLTEAGPVVTSTPLDGVAEAGSVGRPLPGIELRLVDRAGQPLAAPATAVAEQADRSDVPADVPADDVVRAEEPAEVAAAAGSGSNGSGRPDRRSAEPSEPSAEAPQSGTGITDVRATASRVATDVRAAAERGVAEFRAVAERGVAEFRVAAERAATEVRAKVRAGDPVGDMIDDAQDVEGPADLAADIGRIALRGPNLFSGYWPDVHRRSGRRRLVHHGRHGVPRRLRRAAPGRPFVGPRGRQRLHRLPAPGGAGARRAAGRRRGGGDRGAGRAHGPGGARGRGARSGCRGAGCRRGARPLPRSAGPVQGAGAGGVRRRAAAHPGRAAGPPPPGGPPGRNLTRVRPVPGAVPSHPPAGRRTGCPTHHTCRAGCAGRVRGATAGAGS